MGMTFNFDIAGDMTSEQKAAAENGALDPEEVQMQFLCTTEDGGHDPDGEPDEHVRPEHEALHGTVWRLDDPLAPVPPLDYGCRCAMVHVGTEGSFAARVLGNETRKDLTTRGEAYAQWLDKEVDGWEDIAVAVSEMPQAKRIAGAYELLKQAGVADARSVSRMIVDTLPPEKPPHA